MRKSLFTVDVYLIPNVFEALDFNLVGIPNKLKVFANVSVKNVFC